VNVRVLLLTILVTGAGLLALAEVTGKSWPLFLIWPAFGAALPLSTRGERSGDTEAEDAAT
jgi:hypothetical protein